MQYRKLSINTQPCPKRDLIINIGQHWKVCSRQCIFIILITLVRNNEWVMERNMEWLEEVS